MVKIKNVFLIIVLAALNLQACPYGIAKTSVYYLPDAKHLCGEYGVKCSRFLSAVRLQGSGRLAPGVLLRSSGIIEKLKQCTTTVGAAGSCLVPYISVAADPKFYRKGDIISMPSLKGVKMSLGDGHYFYHPGYFVVHDTGGSILGEGRFDIFSLDITVDNSDNSVGYKSEHNLKLYAVNACDSRKKFTVIRKISKDYFLIRLRLMTSISFVNTLRENQIASRRIASNADE